MTTTNKSLSGLAEPTLPQAAVPYRDLSATMVCSVEPVDTGTARSAQPTCEGLLLRKAKHLDSSYFGLGLGTAVLIPRYRGARHLMIRTVAAPAVGGLVWVLLPTIGGPRQEKPRRLEQRVVGCRERERAVVVLDS